MKTEQPRVEDYRFATFGNPRYTYFIGVDEGALKSVVYDAPQPPEKDMDCVGYVNFVAGRRLGDVPPWNVPWNVPAGIDRY